jgi:hypothetical protein
MLRGFNFKHCGWSSDAYIAKTCRMYVYRQRSHFGYAYYAAYIDFLVSYYKYQSRNCCRMYSVSQAGDTFEESIINAVEDFHKNTPGGIYNVGNYKSFEYTVFEGDYYKTVLNYDEIVAKLKPITNAAIIRDILE